MPQGDDVKAGASRVKLTYVDPDLETIKVYRRLYELFRRVGEYALETGDEFTTPLLPGLTLRLSDIFRP